MYYIMTKEQFLPVVVSQGAKFAKRDPGQMRPNAVTVPAINQNQTPAYGTRI
jgi:hypothetical protein